jgi:group I intron endonuclease
MYGLIYKATNLITNKVYVGLTTKSLSERINAHINRGNTEKSVFQKSLKKHGRDNFKFEVIDQANSREELCNKEIYWIKTLTTLSPNGYNLTIGGDGILEMTQEIRNKISKSKKGKKIPKLQGREISHKQRLAISSKLGGRKVIAKNIETQEIKEYAYVTQTKIDGFNPSLVCAVIKGKRKSHKGYIFSYVNTEVSNDVTVDCHRNAYQVKLQNEEYNLGTSVRVDESR